MVELDDSFEQTPESGGVGCDHYSFQECLEQIKHFTDFTQTKTSDWTNVPIISKTEMSELDDNTLYEFDKTSIQDYEKIEPFFDSLDSQRLRKILDEEKEAKQNEKYHQDSCQFCGHAIKFKFFIKNDNTKQYLIIGSACVKGFENVNDGNQEIKINILHTLQNAFDRWINAAINDLDKHHRKYNDRFENVKYKNFYNKLQEFNQDAATRHDFVKLFRKADELRIGIPYDVKELIKKRHNKKSGLDGFF